MKLLVNSLAFGFLAVFICHVSCTGDSNRDASDEKNPQKALVYPWLVTLQGAQCTGSIISKYVVLTAASCFNKVSSFSNITVKVGSFRGNDTVPKHKIVALIKHDNYKKFFDANDVALIKVSPGFEFGANVSKIELASGAHVVMPGTFAIGIYSRWISPKGTERELQEFVRYQLHIEHRLSCPVKIFDDQICASNIDSRPCNFNVGSPLVANDIQVGIRNNGNRCDGVYTQISTFRFWIDNHLKSLDSLSI